MLIKIGSIVQWTEDGTEGPVIAMTKEWCIFKHHDHEIATTWDQIVLVGKPSGDIVSDLQEKHL